MIRARLMSSAAVAALMAGTCLSAKAEPIEIGVGGFMNQYLGYAESDVANRDGFDQQTDAEIEFTGETTLDNGLTFGVNVQLEAQTDGDQIDQQFAYVSGSFGAVYLGGEASAPALMSYDVPSAGIGLDSGDEADWIAGVNIDLLSTVGNFTKDEDASEKLSYFTPRIQGFQLGVSYVPEVDEDIDGPPDNNNGTRDNAFGVAMNYENTFNAVSIAASAAYMDFGEDDAAAGPNPTNLGFGLRLGYAGFTVGGSYNELEDSVAGNIESYGVGVVYETGPAAISFGYVRGEDDGAGTDADGFEVGGTYALGPGVDLIGSIYYVEQDGPGANVDGFAAIGGIALTF